MCIRIILTGGTFDKVYDELAGQLTFRNTHLPDIVKESRCTVPVELEKMKLIDSLAMDETQRQSILDACLKAPEKHIIIVHGTDTMVETASLLGKFYSGRSKMGPPLEKKTIVLTGAMVPYTIAGSDAVFNLGCSFTGVQLLEPGVYIVMNGRVFPWDRVAKNKQKGVFEKV